MFKLIPSVVSGSWVIKQAVGNTPVLLGKKLTTRYFRWVASYAIQTAYVIGFTQSGLDKQYGMLCLAHGL